MPSTSAHEPTATPIPNDLFASFQAGDERALETMFRARYEALTEEAKRKLEDKATAPKVVERAFVKVWGMRAGGGIESPEALEAALHEAVRDFAAREAKRRAMAAKMAHMEGAKEARHAHAQHAPATLDEAWSHVVAALHTPAVDPHLVEEQARLGRHHAAEHIGTVGKGGSKVVPITVGVVIVGAVLGGFFVFERNMADSAINTAIESAQAVEQKTEVAQRGELTLDDSTQVLLGPQTALRVARGFNVENRAVKVTGTASFNVRRGADPAFKVKARNALLTATGTRFDVRAYPADSALMLRVREGTVEVKVGKAVKLVTAGHAARVDARGEIVEPTAKDVDVALGWTEGKVIIEAKPLREAFAEVERWYGLHLATPNPAHLNLPVTMTVPLDSVQNAIDALSRSTGLAFGYAGSNMVLYDPKNKPKGVR